MTKQQREVRAYSVAVWYSSDDRTYIARCMEIPGAEGVGRYPVVALERCYWAILAHLAYRRKLGLKPPEPGAARMMFVQKLQRTIAAVKRSRGRGHRS